MSAKNSRWFIPSTKWEKVRLGAMLLILFGLFTWSYLIPFYWYTSYSPQQGDILFQPLPRANLVIAIEGCTHSPYSHCGVVRRKEEQWVVAEAVGPVKNTSLFSWIKRGRGAKFAVYRLRKTERRHIPAFIQSIEKYYGRPYDIRYRMDDECIYCSELVYKAWHDATGKDLGKVVTLGELDWKPYEKIIREIEGGPPPLKRVMITPAHLSRAPELKKVFSNGI